MDQELKQLIVEKIPPDSIRNVDEKQVVNTTRGWKLASSVDDALAFLNDTATYQSPVGTARVCAMWNGNHPEFYVFTRVVINPSQPEAGDEN